MSARIRAAACVAGAGLAIAACGSGGTSTGSPAGSGGGKSAPLVTITAGVSATSSSAAMFLGIDHGFFKQHGINLKTGQILTGATAITAMINGQQNVALGAITPVVSAVAAGIPIQVVSGSVDDRSTPQGDIDEVIAGSNSGITSFKDLQGKTVGINGLNCCFQYWVDKDVADAGGNPATVKFVALLYPDQVTGLEQHKVDAVATSQPYATELQQAGFKSIGDPAAAAFGNPDNGNTVFFMAKSFITAHPGIVQKWQAALQESSTYANAHPAEVRTAIEKLTKADASLINAVPLPTYTAAIDKAAVQEEAALDGQYGTVKSVPSMAKLVAP